MTPEEGESDRNDPTCSEALGVLSVTATLMIKKKKMVASRDVFCGFDLQKQVATATQFLPSTGRHILIQDSANNFRFLAPLLINFESLGS